MMKHLIKRLITGIAAGGLVTFFFVTIFKFNHMTLSADILWYNMIGSFAVGIYFATSPLVFEYDQWSPLKQTVIHFILSIIVYYSIALPLGWIPITTPAIIISVVLFILLYALCWIGFKIYFKRMAEDLNKVIKEK
ncbi:DUF3021 domain-containing protein [Lentibacillus saliphilus]|uniref:DUF3021 domain-containing protein n=1 Tax=Lentibacillus saliphilus TaxID=2737028 RepID=UPI001C3037B1|nr:DUF3021 domain-containing protein [Lentibacillus saliphilus]